MDAKQKTLTKFLQALDTHALHLENAVDRQLYVPSMVKEMVGEDPIKQLAFQIGAAKSSSVYLFSGMIGTGKSTQLLRLAKDLTDKGHIAVYVDMGHIGTTTTPVSIVDLMLSVVGAFSERASEALSQDVVKEDYWTRASNFFKSKIRIEGFDFGFETGAPGVKATAKVKVEMENNPSFKQKLQAATGGLAGEFIKDVRQYVGDIAEKWLAGKPADTRIVLILDSMERIQGNGTASDPVMASVRKLFRENFDELILPPLQVVYTVSPYLRKLEPTVYARVGAANVATLATLPVYMKEDGRTGRDSAIAPLVEFLERRFPDWINVLTAGQLRDIILKSGGDFREFANLLRSLVSRAAVDDDVKLPLPDTFIASTCKVVARDRLPLQVPVRERLKVIHQTQQPQLNTDADYDGFVADLTVKNALMYLNGEEWYGVHPLLWEEMKKPSPIPAATSIPASPATPTA